MMRAYLVTLRRGDGLATVETWAGDVQGAWRQVIAYEHLPLSAVVSCEPRLEVSEAHSGDTAPALGGSLR